MPAGLKRQMLEVSLADLSDEFRAHIILIDQDIASIWGILTARTRRIGIQLAVPDGLIAATALHHEMTILTRNVKDFEPTGVPLINPWE